ncbi:hypothetical protein [Nocardioides sp.]|uniref:phage tail fiber protein n=1 Tax=Nocardioides sp. TaxID=35761 RepID=UPI0035685372
MSKSDVFENELLLLIFNNTDIANIGDAAGLQNSATAGNLYLALHTADPGEAGTAVTNEIAYTGYARVAVPRTPAGFTVSGSSVTLTENEDFPKMTGGTGGTVTHWSVVKEPSGPATILYSGEVDPDIIVANGVTPRLEQATSITED